MKLELHPDALSDLREAAAWYETQRHGLADTFLARIEAALALKLVDARWELVAKLHSSASMPRPR